MKSTLLVRAIPLPYFLNLILPQTGPMNLVPRPRRAAHLGKPQGSDMPRPAMAHCRFIARKRLHDPGLDHSL